AADVPVDEAQPIGLLERGAGQPRRAGGDERAAQAEPAADEVGLGHVGAAPAFDLVAAAEPQVIDEHRAALADLDDQDGAAALAAALQAQPRLGEVAERQQAEARALDARVVGGDHVAALDQERAAHLGGGGLLVAAHVDALDDVAGDALG